MLRDAGVDAAAPGPELGRSVEPEAERAPLLEPKDPARIEYRRDNRIADGQVRRVTGDKLGQAAQTKLPVDEVVTASGNLVAAKESLIQSQATSNSVRRSRAEATLDF